MNELMDSQQCTPEAFEAYRSMLATRKELSCRILSNSMDPLVKAGDSISISPVSDPLALKRFELIVFLYGDRLYCHFVWAIWKAPPGIQTRSLQEPLENDLPIEPRYVLGRVTNRELSFRAKARMILVNLIRGTG